MTWYMHGLWIAGYCTCGTLVLFNVTQHPGWIGVTILCLLIINKLGYALIDYVRERGCNV